MGILVHAACSTPAISLFSWDTVTNACFISKWRDSIQCPTEDEYFEMITKSANELDLFIKNIIDKTQAATNINHDDKIKPSFKE